MRLERVSLAIVVLVALIAAVVPFWRGLALSQLRQTMPCRAEHFCIGTDPIIPSPHPKTDAQLLKERPRDFLLRVALAQKALSPCPSALHGEEQKLANTVADALVRDFPRQGAAFAIAMDAPRFSDVDVPRRMEGWSIDPVEARKNWHDPGPPTKAQVEGCLRCINLLNRAIVADPGNGWFHYMKAGYLFGLHRDNEAIAEIQRTALSPRFTDYSDLRAKAWNHLCDLRGGVDPIARSNSRCSVPYPHLAFSRETARIAAHLAYAQTRQANMAQGVRQALDLSGSGHNMMRHAPTFIHALVGKAILAIGAHAIEPTFESKKKDMRAQQDDKFAHYERFLDDHGFGGEAARLSKQWMQAGDTTRSIRSYINADAHSGLNALFGFPASFETGASVIATLIVLGLCWGGAALLTVRGGGRAMWDRRAGVTTALLSSLVLAPMIVRLVLANQGWGDVFPSDDAWDVRKLSPAWLLIPASIIVLSLCVGLAMMLMRAPREGENRKTPVWSLLVAWAAVIAGMAYTTNGMSDFAESSRFFDRLDLLWPALTILLPAALLSLYAILRAVQSRFGRVRRSAPVTFIATIRYGAAVAVALFAIVYLVLMPYTAHLGARADDFARGFFAKEAAVVQSAFK